MSMEHPAAADALASSALALRGALRERDELHMLAHGLDAAEEDTAAHDRWFRSLLLRAAGGAEGHAVRERTTGVLLRLDVVPKDASVVFGRAARFSELAVALSPAEALRRLRVFTRVVSSELAGGVLNSVAAARSVLSEAELRPYMSVVRHIAGVLELPAHGAHVGVEGLWAPREFWACVDRATGFTSGERGQASVLPFEMRIIERELLVGEPSMGWEPRFGHGWWRPGVVHVAGAPSSDSRTWPTRLHWRSTSAILLPGKPEETLRVLEDAVERPQGSLWQCALRDIQEAHSLVAMDVILRKIRAAELQTLLESVRSRPASRSTGIDSAALQAELLALLALGAGCWRLGVVESAMEVRSDVLFTFSPLHTTPGIIIGSGPAGGPPRGAQGSHVSNERSGASRRKYALGTVGFNRGVHYWEVSVTSCQSEMSSIIIGVMERPWAEDCMPFAVDEDLPPRVRSSPDVQITHGTNVRALITSRGMLDKHEQRAYGMLVNSGDIIGVRLDCERGVVSFFFDGKQFGEHVLRDFGPGASNLATGVLGETNPPPVWYPLVGLSQPADVVELTHKWTSCPAPVVSLGMLGGMSAGMPPTPAGTNVPAGPGHLPGASTPLLALEGGSDPDLVVAEVLGVLLPVWRTSKCLLRPQELLLAPTTPVEDARANRKRALAVEAPDSGANRRSRLRRDDGDSVYSDDGNGGTHVAFDSNGDDDISDEDTGNVDEVAAAGGARGRLPGDLAIGGAIEDEEEQGCVSEHLMCLLRAAWRRWGRWSSRRFRRFESRGGVLVDLDVSAAGIDAIAPAAMIGRLRAGDLVSCPVLFQRVHEPPALLRVLGAAHGRLWYRQAHADSPDAALAWFLHPAELERLMRVEDDPVEDVADIVHVAAEDDEDGDDSGDGGRDDAVEDAAAAAAAAGGGGAGGAAAGGAGGAGEPAAGAGGNGVQPGGLGVRRSDSGGSVDGITARASSFAAFCERAGFVRGTGAGEGAAVADEEISAIASAACSRQGIVYPQNLRPRALLEEAARSRSPAVQRLLSAAPEVLLVRFVVLLELSQLATSTARTLHLSRLEETDLGNKEDGARGRRSLVQVRHEVAPGALAGLVSPLDDERLEGQRWHPRSLAWWLRERRGLILAQSKFALWKERVQATTTRTPTPAEDFAEPRTIAKVKITRGPSAQMPALAAVPSSNARIGRTVFGQLMQALNTHDVALLRQAYIGTGHGGQPRAFRVSFRGEGVDDYGGPYRALFVRIAEELQMDGLAGQLATGEDTLLPFFIPCANRRRAAAAAAGGVAAAALPGPSPLQRGEELFVVNPSADLVTPGDLRKFMFVGKVLGMCLRHGIQLDLSLAPVFWKALTGEAATLGDLEATDAVLGAILRSPTMPAPERLAALGLDGSVPLTFVVPLSDGELVELVPAGRLVEVTPELWPDFQRLALSRRLRESEAQMDAIRAGLSSIVPCDTLELFRWEELQQMVQGHHDVPVELLQRASRYSGGLTQRAAPVSWMWEVLEEATAEDRVAFLDFVCARRRLPVNNSGAGVRIGIEPMEGAAREEPDGFLPTAKTCLVTLSLPRYSSKEVLRQRLLVAIHHSPTMDADFRTSNAEGWA